MSKLTIGSSSIAEHNLFKWERRPVAVHPHHKLISPDFQVNGRKQKQARETGDPLVHPAKRLEKRQHDRTSSGENTGSGIKKTRSTNVPRVAQAVTPKTLDSPSISFQQRSSKHKPPQPKPEHSSDNSDHLSKRPRIDKDRLIEHWALNEYEWPKRHLEVDTMGDFFARPKTPSLHHTKSNASLNTPSETSSQEAKSRPYTTKNYEIFLESKGIFLNDHKDGITTDSKTFYQELLEQAVDTPNP
ncbi:hypothetical protein EMCG_03377 [[Emmonsia] crescens]|uniref:Uncharacterized protein n=1 Tax=[Emmonsia] crescens TaxID=73230 RepID=A0A0G2HVP2_9EURO|nr:hypothetical protein EMCG_03377 [Emmonsia crescens UAMH 3008]